MSEKSTQLTDKTILKRLNKIGRIALFMQESGYMTATSDNYIVSWIESGKCRLNKEEFEKEYISFTEQLGSLILLKVGSGKV